MQAGDKKLKHKDYEKNRRLKLNEELRANETSNELLDSCINKDTPLPLPPGVRDGNSSGEESREEAVADAADEEEVEDLERANKRTILRRTCDQLETLTDSAADRVLPDIFRGPMDLEALALKNLECSVIQLVVETGKILLTAGSCEPVFGLSCHPLVGRCLWDFLPEDRRTDYESLIKAFAATARTTEEDKLTTLITLRNCQTGRFSAVLMEGKFSDDANEGRLLTCLLQEEPDDHLYEAASTYLSVSLQGSVVGVVPGFEHVFLRTEEEVKTAGLSRLLQSSRGEAADLCFLFHADQLQSGDVNPENCTSIVLEDSFRVLDKEGRPLPGDYTLVMKPIANPLNFDNFVLIGINLLLINVENFSKHISTYKCDTESADALHRIMSWTDS